MPVEYNRLTVSELNRLMNPPVNTWRCWNTETRPDDTQLHWKTKVLRRLSGDDDARHHPETEGIRNSGIVCKARGDDGAVGEPSMESSSVTILRRRNENHAEDTRSDSNTQCENGVTTEVRLVHDWTDTRGIRFGRKKKI